jgi:hypothetical protein
MERRRTGSGRGSDDRRQGERRSVTGQVLQFRRGNDNRVDAGMFSALVQRLSFTHRPVASEPTAALAVVEPLTEPVSEEVACPECGEPWDRLWLVRHLAAAHPGWS